MSNQKTTEKAFQAFLEQTEKAKAEGWIYTEDFQKLLYEARSTAFPDSSQDRTYEYQSEGFHVVQQ